MPTHDGVRVHDDQGCSPLPPRVGEQPPRQSISMAESGTRHGALEHGQLLTKCQILERDRSVSTADQRERSKRDDERSQHELSCPGTATASTGTGDLILANDSIKAIIVYPMNALANSQEQELQKFLKHGHPDGRGPVTFAYLNSALQDVDTTVFKLTGRDGFADRTATVEQFRRAGGLLVGTDGGISEGIELGDVPHVVHYDLPLSAEAVEQRRGRVDRYGRTGPLTMYVFLDDSGAIPSEVEASDRLNALRSAVENASALTEHVDADGSVSH